MSVTSVTGLDTKTAEHEAAHRRLRWLCRCVALALGAASAWASRSTMYPDGISYLDIGDAFWRGNWHAAINAYWSPLYPLVLGFFLRAFPAFNALGVSPGPCCQLPDLCCRTHLLRVFPAHLPGATAIERPSAGGASETSLPGWAWMLVGYSTFIASSLLLITLSFVSGDMIVAAVIYLASAILLKLHRGDDRLALIRAARTRAGRWVSCQSRDVPDVCRFYRGCRRDPKNDEQGNFAA